MSGLRVPRWPVAGLLLAAAAGAWAADAAPGAVAVAEAQERRQLAAERRRIDALHDAHERDCAARFAVTTCLEENRHRRREALAAVHARTAALDDRQRARRAEARQRRIDAKVARQAQSRAERASSPLLVLPMNAAR